MAAHSASTLLTRIGDYEVHPLEVCSEEQIALLFAKVCQRGNPLLEGRPEADLLVFGRALYRKSVAFGMSQVVLLNGEPVALNTNWDASSGGAWAGSGLTMPASLGFHAAVAVASFNSLPKTGDKVVFAAFGGVLKGHPAKFFGLLAWASWMMATRSGYHKSFQYSVLPKLVGRSKLELTLEESDVQRMWDIKFEDVTSSTPTLQAELKASEGVSTVSLSHISFLTGKTYTKLLATTLRATPDEVTVPALEIASNHLKLRTGASSNL